MTDDEIHRFFEAAEGVWYYNLFVVMIQTGCRAGEACALMYEDVGEEFLSIKRTVTRNEDGNYVIGSTAKTKAGVREIPLNDTIREVLADQREFNEKNHMNKDEGDTLYFHNSRGGVTSAHHINETIEVICRDNGIEPFSTHAFRHTFATRAIESGMMPKTLQDILGHADINMTMNLYSHVMDETKIKEMGRVHISL